MKLKTVRNELLKFRKDEYDGQDYETAANLIAGNQLIAAANFIDILDSFPRDEMNIIFMITCPKVYYEMFGSALEFYGDSGLIDDQGVWSEFAEEEMYNNMSYEDMPTRKLKAILRELQNNGVGKGVKDLMEMRQIENILLERKR